MSLDADEIERLTLEATLRRAPSIEGDEARQYYDKVKEEIEEIMRQGLIVNIVREIPG